MVGSVFNHCTSKGEGNNIRVLIIISEKEWGIRLNSLKSTEKNNWIES